MAAGTAPAPIQPNPGLPTPVIAMGGLGIPVVCLVDSGGAEVSGDATGATLSAQSALNTNGSAVDMGRVVNNPLQVINASAGVSAGQVALQGSLDGTNWYVVSAGTALTAPGITTNTATTPNSIPARYLRSVITTGIVGGTVTVTVGGA